ncbi:MAG: endonuclease/exonuclease/phosphatase family protein [Kiritimatiellia bacterium]
MSFNIRYGRARDGVNSWDKRRELVFQTIRRENADLIGLQEALRFQVDEIRAAVPEYAEIGEGRDGGKKGESSVILYRKRRFEVVGSGTFWLSDTPKKPSISWGNACRRVCTWGRFVDRKSEQSFYHFNTHLDHRSQPSREKSVRLLVQRIKNRDADLPFVLTGDFNAGEDNTAVLYLKGKLKTAEKTPVSMTDTYRMLYPKEKTVGTFNGFKGKTDGPKIDYIFISSGCKVHDAEIIRPREGDPCPSDHFPVTARISPRQP